MEATSPRIPATLSRKMSLFTIVADSPCFDWLSSVTSSICLPRTPPAAFASSIARRVPLWEDWPKAASFPVRDAYSPILIVSWERAGADRATRAATAAKRGREGRGMDDCVAADKGRAGGFSTQLPYIIDNDAPACFPSRVE